MVSVLLLTLTTLQPNRPYEMNERRACRVIGTDRTSVRYRGVRPGDEVLRERLKALAEERRRFGYHRLHVLLRREGHAVNKKRIQRLYREERLTVRRRGGRKRAMGTRRPIATPLAPNQRWSLYVIQKISERNL
jgi:putative transposase